MFDLVPCNYSNKKLKVLHGITTANENWIKMDFHQNCDEGQ